MKCFVLPCSVVIDSLDPGLHGGTIHPNAHFSLRSECKNNDLQASIPCSIYIILVRHYTGATLFTPCNMMHPTIKNCCLNNNYNSRVRTCVNLCTAATPRARVGRYYNLCFTIIAQECIAIYCILHDFR